MRYIKNYRKNKRPMLTPAQVIVAGFLTVISVGGTLLLFPFSRQSGAFASGVQIIESYFTATSAACVTGLVLCDTATTWSAFGQAVILCMIQIGGLGFMTMTVIISLLIRRKITPKERILIAQSLNLSSSSGLIRLIKKILLGTLIIETAGALILTVRFIPMFGVGRGIWYSVFHSVSSFCNAGFDLLGTRGGEFSSAMSVNGDVVILMTFSALIITGGIGFVVWDDVLSFFRRKKPLSVYSRFVLTITAVLLAAGTVLTLAGEYNNTLGEMNFFKKLMNAFFHSVTTRTAGFDAIGNGNLNEFTKVISIILMLIGGASGSTAGGIKVGTFGLLVYTVYSVAMGKSTIVLYKRRISYENILRAMAIGAIGLTITFIASFVIGFTTSADYLDILFETSSAFATVGLSSVGTSSLGVFAWLVLMVLMFFGRVGVLTITYALMLKLTRDDNILKYPEAQMLIG